MVAHCTVIGLALFGGPLQRADDVEMIQISEVSLMTSAEFEAMSSPSPTPAIEIPEQVQPSLPTAEVLPAPTQETVPVIPDLPVEETAPEAEDAPDVSGLQELVTPDVEVESPTIAPQANDSVGATLVVPDSPIADQQNNGVRQPDRLALIKPQPRPALRIDSTPAEKPPTDAETAAEAQQATTPDAAATEPAEQIEEQAPKEAATEVVTKPDIDPNSAAPAKSSRPRGRPRDIARKAQQAKDNAAKVVKAAKAKAAREAKAAEAEAIRDALIKATSEALNAAPSGPPLTSSERSGLVLAVQQCWNVPAGLENAGDLVVILSVELSRDGKLESNPRLIDPAGAPQGTIRQAYEAGRRALIRCAPYDLPQDKYEQWRQLEVVFNPKQMVVK